jgi:Leucine-rich repeat (LRR) protein
MLNTFDNAERQHFRRQERDHHLQAIDTIDFTNPLFLCLEESNLTLAADALVGVPLARQPLPPSRRVDSASSRRRRGKRTAMLVLGTVFATVLGLLFAFDLGGDENREAPVTVTKEADPSTARYNRLSSMILDWEVTPKSVLEDNTSFAAQALQWLAYEDLTSENVETIRSRYSLATLYFSTKGSASTSSWNVTSHWLSSNPVCLWHGVDCLDKENTIGLVQSLNLSANGLVGKLPPEISLLQLDIRSLDLSSNSIEGAIPDLSSLKSMQHLYLGPNEFTSSIPSSIYQLSGLTHLYLNDCKLTGPVSQNIGDLTKLQGLDLHNNFFEGTLSTRIGDLEDLRVLYLDGNSLYGTIPTTIGKLSDLVDLRLGRNNLSGSIPTEIANLRLLQILYLDTNRLTGAVPFGTIENLLLMRELQLHGNRLSGSVPSALASLALLGVLYLDENELTGSLPTELGKLRYLEEMYLSSNKLTGVIPSAFGSMKNLKLLKINGNEIGGYIPSELGLLTNLETIDLGSNALFGKIPVELSHLSSLEHARFHGNHLSGIVPVWLCPEFIHGLVELTADCGAGIICDCCTLCYD